jgi:beta-lactamase regulating signal transducer with metallopeptidase domain
MSEEVLALLGESSLRVAAAVLAVWLAVTALRIRPGAARHAAWTAVLLAMMAMPLLPRLMPAVPMPLPVAVAVPAIEVWSLPPEQPPIGALVAHPVAITAAPVASTLPGPARPVTLVALALAAYGVVAGLLLVSLARGWWAAQRLVGTSSSVVTGRAVAVRESPLVHVPITVGVAAPVVLLPRECRQWSDETLRAVLAHEGAHVKRRDPLVHFLARLNRCVFWFHPAAWWVERELAESAEHACDAAAAREVGTRRYAEVLIEMAAIAGHAGGRLAAVGVHGSALGARVERMLTADVAPPSALRMATLAGVSLAGIVIAAACRAPIAPTPPPLRDPSAAEREQSNSDSLMTWEQTAELERVVRAKPDDLATRERLLRFYRGPLAEGREDARLAVRRHALYVIERHPESSLAGSDSTHLRATRTWNWKTTDAEGYGEARRLWLRHTSRPEASATVLAHAAEFFDATDEAQAEELLLRLRNDVPEHSRKLVTWRLGRLYGRAIGLLYPPRAFTPRAQQALDESRDPDLLTAAASSGFGGYSSTEMQRKHQELARALIDRALAIDGGHPEARARRLSLQRATRVGPNFRRMATRYAEVSALPEVERFERLGDLALKSYRTGETAIRSDDKRREYVDLAFGDARRFAEDALALAPAYRSHPDYGTVVYKAHLALGRLALRSGDRRQAVRHLQLASEVPSTEELVYTRDITTGGLPDRLLDAGERETVIAFFERLARINIPGRDGFLEAATAIRRGEKPRYGNTASLLWAKLGPGIDDALSGAR